jgi:hypothetical protein
MPQSVTLPPQLPLALIAVLVLGALPNPAVCDSLKIQTQKIQTHEGERPAENDAVAMIETRFKKETDKYDKAFDDFQKSSRSIMICRPCTSSSKRK